MRSWYRELGLELVSLEENYSFHPKQPPMEKQKRDGQRRRFFQDVAQGIPRAIEERDDGKIQSDTS
jgi:hypothetical protein